MAFEFLKELLEAGQTHALINNPEFNALAKAAPQFADKLITAWNGDDREYVRTHGKSVELLFPKMLGKITKYVPELPMTPQLQKAVGDLIRLHAASFPPVPQDRRIDTSVWQNERWAKESIEFDLGEYEVLREEYEAL